MKRKIYNQWLPIAMAGVMLLSAPVTALAADTPPSPPSGTEGGQGPGGGSPGSQSSDISWTGATVISEDGTYVSGNYSSSTDDENALLVNGSGINVTLTDPVVTKSGTGSASDNQSFYGINSAIMAKGGANVTISGAKVTTTAKGANGVFSYGGSATTNNTSTDGTTVTISDSTITTSADGSGGIMTTGGGKTIASNLTVETSGGSSAPIRTDRGGGTVIVTGGTYTSNGLGSPAIYSTADIMVSGATLVSNQSEGVCIEGTNSVALNNCNLTANNTNKNGNAQYLDSIMIYQSMSGDAGGTDSMFAMAGGTLTSKSGHVFHVTNTTGEIDLNGSTIINEDSEGVLLSVTNDGWSGNSNSAIVNATNQTLNGNIIVSSTSSTKSSSISNLTLNLKDGSIFTGKLDDGSGSNNFGTVTVTIGSNSLWVLDGDSYVSSISGEGNINYNGHTLYVDGTAYTASNPYSGIAATTDTTVNENTESSDDGSSSNEENSGANTTVTKKGKVTIPKGVKKGTYKITLKAAANSTYKAAKNVTVSFVIKG